jgi:hypothetical protein
MLGERAGTGHRAGVADIVGAIESQHAIVRDVADD